jgi:hypothetical protein
MHRSTAHTLRNGALASIGLYSIVVLVALALSGGFQGARNVQPDGVDKSALFQRFNEVLPNALAVLQQSLRPHS